MLFRSLENTNFSLNDEEFNKIKNISNQIQPDVLILFWQFCINSLDELDIVSNQHLSIEMFLIRLMHLSSVKQIKQIDTKPKEENSTSKIEIKTETKIIDQIKNISQEEKKNPEIQTEVKAEIKAEINSFDELITTCTSKRELKLKFEDRKSTRLNSSHSQQSRMPSSA